MTVRTVRARHAPHVFVGERHRVLDLAVDGHPPVFEPDRLGHAQSAAPRRTGASASIVAFRSMTGVRIRVIRSWSSMITLGWAALPLGQPFQVLRSLPSGCGVGKCGGVA